MMTGQRHRCDTTSAKEQEVRDLVADIKSITQAAAAAAAADLTSEYADVLVRHTCKLLDYCQEEPLVELFVLEGGVEAVVPLLTVTHTENNSSSSNRWYVVAGSACRLLALLASRHELKRFVATQALPGLLQLLNPNGVDTLDPEGACCAVGALAAMGHDSRRMQELLCAEGALDGVSSLLATTLCGAGVTLTQCQPELQSHCVTALRSLTGKSEACRGHFVEVCGGLQLLVKVLSDGEAAAQQEALGLMSDLIHDNKSTRTAALQAGVLEALVWLLSDGEASLQAAAALLVGQLAAPPLTQRDLEANIDDGFSIELDLVPTLVPLLSCSNSRSSSSSTAAVQEMAAFALARLAQVPAYQAAVAQNQGIPALLDLLSSPTEAVSYNAAFALYELAASEAVAGLMMQAGAVAHLTTVCRHMQRGQRPRACLEHTLLRLQQHAQQQQQQQQQQQHDQQKLTDKGHLRDQYQAVQRHDGVTSHSRMSDVRTHRDQHQNTQPGAAPPAPAAAAAAAPAVRPLTATAGDSNLDKDQYAVPKSPLAAAAAGGSAIPKGDQHAVPKGPPAAAAAAAGNGSLVRDQQAVPKGPTAAAATAAAGGLTLVPLLVPATVASNDIPASPLAETIFGGKGNSCTHSLGQQQQRQQHQHQQQNRVGSPVAPLPLRLPSIDGTIGEAAAASAQAAAIAAAHTRADQQHHHQQQQQQQQQAPALQTDLQAGATDVEARTQQQQQQQQQQQAPALLTDLRERAAAVETLLQQLQQQQQGGAVGGVLLKLCLQLLLDAAAVPLQQQQLVARVLLQQQQQQQQQQQTGGADAATCISPAPTSAGPFAAGSQQQRSAATAAVAGGKECEQAVCLSATGCSLAGSACAHAHVVTSLLQSLASELAQTAATAAAAAGGTSVPSDTAHVGQTFAAAAAAAAETAAIAEPGTHTIATANQQAWGSCTAAVSTAWSVLVQIQQFFYSWPHLTSLFGLLCHTFSSIYSWGNVTQQLLLEAAASNGLVCLGACTAGAAAAGGTGRSLGAELCTAVLLAAAAVLYVLPVGRYGLLLSVLFGVSALVVLQGGSAATNRTRRLLLQYLAQQQQQQQQQQQGIVQGNQTESAATAGAVSLQELMGHTAAVAAVAAAAAATCATAAAGRAPTNIHHHQQQQQQQQQQQSGAGAGKAGSIWEAAVAAAAAERGAQHPTAQIENCSSGQNSSKSGNSTQLACDSSISTGKQHMALDGMRSSSGGSSGQPVASVPGHKGEVNQGHKAKQQQQQQQQQLDASLPNRADSNPSNASSSSSSSTDPNPNQTDMPSSSLLTPGIVLSLLAVAATALSLWPTYPGPARSGTMAYEVHGEPGPPGPRGYEVHGEPGPGPWPTTIRYMQYRHPVIEAVEAYGAGHAVLGLVLIAASVAWLLQLLHGRKQQQQDLAASLLHLSETLQQQQQQKFLQPMSTAETCSNDMPPPTQQQQQKPILVLTNMHPTIGSGPAVPKHLIPKHTQQQQQQQVATSSRPTKSSSGSSSSSSSSDKARQRASLQATVAAAERAAEAAGCSRLTSKALQKLARSSSSGSRQQQQQRGVSLVTPGTAKGDRNGGHSCPSDKPQFSRDASPRSGSKWAARSCRDTRQECDQGRKCNQRRISDQGSEGSNGACTPRVSVQGRFACPPSDTTVVTAWELVTPNGANNSLLAAAAAVAATGSSGSGRKGSSGDASQLSSKAGGCGKADKSAAAAAATADIAGGGGGRCASKQSILESRS